MRSDVLRRIAEAVFPARCIGCEIRGTSLCAACRRALPYLPAGTCGRCAGYRSARGGCSSCRRLAPTLQTIRAAFAYDGAARTAVVTLKFRSGRYLVPLMGELLRNELARHALRAEVVVPVPLTPRRGRARGFNQATLLAAEIAETVGGVLVTDALRRHERPAQRTLTAPERMRNLRGAIQCIRPDAVTGRRVLLVDDVVTTGATLSACAASLATAGAQRVSALAFARDL